MRQPKKHKGRGRWQAALKQLSIYAELFLLRNAFCSDMPCNDLYQSACNYMLCLFSPSSPTETVTVTTKTLIITDKRYESAHTQRKESVLYHIQMVFMLVKLFSGSQAFLKGRQCKYCMRRTALTFAWPLFSSHHAIHPYQPLYFLSLAAVQRGGGQWGSLELTCDDHSHWIKVVYLHLNALRRLC